MTNYNNIEYEKALLGSMILDNTIIDDVVIRVSTETFFNPFHQFIYNKIVELYKQNGVIDLVTLSAVAGADKVAKVAELTDFVSSSSQWEFYADKLHNMYLARKVQKELLEKASSVTPDNAKETIHEIDEMLCSYMAEAKKEASTTEGMVMRFLAYQESMQGKLSRYTGLDTGWDNLSSILDGLQLGELMMIGARPSIGKTAFGLQMMNSISASNIPSCMFSLEMGERSIMDRLVAMESGVSLAKIRTGEVMRSVALAGKINAALDRLYKKPFYTFYDIRDIDEIISTIKVMAKTRDVKVFLIDHLTLVHYKDTSINRNTQLDLITQKLHALCQELDIAIICLCQLNRNSEGKKPTLADLRDSGTIEQNTDTCLFLHRERVTSETQLEIETEILVVKNRNGACGTAKMVFHPMLTRFTEDCA